MQASAPYVAHTFALERRDAIIVTCESIAANGGNQTRAQSEGSKL